MLKRVVSSIIGAPLLIGFVLLGGVYLEIGVLLLTIIGLYEFYAAFKSKNIHPIKWVGYLATILIYLGYYFEFSLTLQLVTTCVVFVLLVYNMLGKHNHLLASAVTVFGMLYITYFFYHIIMISDLDSNFFIWYIFILAWANDTCAYFVGVKFGSKKILPSVSPNKTVEGALGGIIGSTIASCVYAYHFNQDFFLFAIYLGVFGSIVAMAGDFVASKIKRQLDVKDFGNIIPGHGGILDRFDSILFTAPLVYYFMILYGFFVK